LIADTTEALRLKPNQALYNMRGSAYYDKGEYDIAIADFNDALRIGPPSGIIFHNRGNALRSKGDFAHAIADYDEAIRLNPKEAYSYQNRGSAKQALGDLDGALADINQAIRLNPALPSPLINRTVIWRAKGDYDRAIADATEAIGLANAKTPVNIMTPPGSVLISAYLHRALAYEAKGDFEHAKPDFDATLAGAASDAGSKANQATAKVRLALLSDPVEPAPQPPRTPPPASSGEPQTATSTGWTTAADFHSGSAVGRGSERKRRPAGRAGDRQRRLCPCQGATQSAQRRPLNRQEPARHRLCRFGRLRSRPRGDAEDDPRLPA
jgi:tetratricopeptide (TPR) repeat protein